MIIIYCSNGINQKGFTRFIEIGRVALINYGEDSGKLCVIVDILNGNQVLIDCPTLGVVRHIISVRRLSLTDIKIHAKKGIKTSKLEFT